MKVFEFLHNNSCCESAAGTLSIHITKRGARKAMLKHIYDTKKDYCELYTKKEREEYSYDFDMWWGIRETELKN